MRYNRSHGTATANKNCRNTNCKTFVLQLHSSSPFTPLCGACSAQHKQVALVGVEHAEPCVTVAHAPVAPHLACLKHLHPKTQQ